MHEKVMQVSSRQYEIIELNTFRQEILIYTKQDQMKIRKKIAKFLSEDPFRGQKLAGQFELGSVNLYGMRRIKAGAKGYRKGVRIFYRICSECLNQSHFKHSRVRCDFCSPEKPMRVVVFSIRPRKIAYVKK